MGYCLQLDAVNDTSTNSYQPDIKDKWEWTSSVTIMSWAVLFAISLLTVLLLLHRIICQQSPDGERWCTRSWYCCIAVWATVLAVAWIGLAFVLMLYYPVCEVPSFMRAFGNSTESCTDRMGAHAECIDLGKLWSKDTPPTECKCRVGFEQPSQIPFGTHPRPINRCCTDSTVHVKGIRFCSIETQRQNNAITVECL
eukprot:m.1034310 g.1034310  ORF g.1034310 m.1034310 type:complete len:197 (-) comp24135_c0_seq24:4313-4903(-)